MHTTRGRVKRPVAGHQVSSATRAACTAVLPTPPAAPDDENLSGRRPPCVRKRLQFIVREARIVDRACIESARDNGRRDDHQQQRQHERSVSSGELHDQDNRGYRTVSRRG